MAPNQPIKLEALAVAHKHALELHAAAARMLSATAMLHVVTTDGQRRALLLGLTADTRLAQHCAAEIQEYVAGIKV